MGDKPPQTFGRRQYRDQWRRFLVRNRLLVLALALITAATMALQAVAADGYWLGVGHGVVLVAMAALLTTQFWAHTGAFNALVGGWGEDETRAQLRTATRSNHIYGWVDGIEVANTDIDHLVATPAGWYALDSKWHGRPMRRIDFDRDADSATFVARKAKSVMRHHHLVADVLPVVVVWGGAASALPAAGQYHGGVVFVPGHHLTGWFAQQRGHRRLDHDRAHQYLARLHSFRDDYLKTPRR